MCACLNVCLINGYLSNVSLVEEHLCIFKLSPSPSDHHHVHGLGHGEQRSYFVPKLVNSIPLSGKCVFIHYCCHHSCPNRIKCSVLFCIFAKGSLMRAITSTKLSSTGRFSFSFPFLSFSFIFHLVF
jgi:hypothetical protein